MTERLTDHELEFLRALAEASCKAPGAHSWQDLTHEADNTDRWSSAAGCSSTPLTEESLRRMWETSRDEPIGGSDQGSTPGDEP